MAAPAQAPAALARWWQADQPGRCPQRVFDGDPAACGLAEQMHPIEPQRTTDGVDLVDDRDQRPGFKFKDVKFNFPKGNE